MKFFLSFIFFSSLVGCAFSEKTAHVTERTVASSKYLNINSLKIINLTNIQILDSHNENAFPWPVSVNTKISAQTMASIKAELGPDPILSRIYTGSSNSMNIYTFITQSTDKKDIPIFKLVVIMESKTSLSKAYVDYDIQDALPRELKVVNGPSDDLIKYRVVPEMSFFPI